MKPFVSSSIVVIAFAQNLSIRKRVFEFEDALKSVFKTPFQTIPVPDNYNPNFPRFQSESQNGHSKLEVCQTGLRIETNYDDQFASDILKVGTYVKDRIDLAKEILKQEQVQYVGLVLTLEYELEQMLINQMMAEHSGFKAIDRNTIDFTFRYAAPFSMDFFLGVSCSKYIQQLVTFDLAGKVLPNPNQATRYGIQVTLDLNSRRAFQAGTLMEEQPYDKISETLLDIIKSCTLDDYLSGNIRTSLSHN